MRTITLINGDGINAVKLVIFHRKSKKLSGKETMEDVLFVATDTMLCLTLILYQELMVDLE